VAAFGLGDGTVVLARAEWAGGPEVRAREGDGGVEVTPPTDPSPPVTRVSVHTGRCLALVADPAAFLTGGEDGRVVRLESDGTASEPQNERTGRPIELLAAGAGGAAGWRAAVSGRHVHITGPGRHILEMPDAVTALAFDPAGHRLAIAHRGDAAICGASLWSDDGAALRRLSSPGLPLSLAWSPDGSLLVAGLQEGAPPDWRLADDRLADGTEIALLGAANMQGVASLAFAYDGSFLAASGAPRVACWRRGPADSFSPDPVACGLANRRALVALVACHPASPMIAAGYGNGAVLLCQPGFEDALFARPWGGGGVTALAWSSSGRRLALGTSEGEVANAAAAAGAAPRAQKPYPRGRSMSREEDVSKDRFFDRTGALAEEMVAAHGNDFAMGVLILAALHRRGQAAAAWPSRRSATEDTVVIRRSDSVASPVAERDACARARRTMRHVARRACVRRIATDAARSAIAGRAVPGTPLAVIRFPDYVASSATGRSV
jgi:hypothetical protein